MHGLPSRHGLSSETLSNRALDVKSAALNYITIHLSHEYSRLGIGGNSVHEVGSKTRPDSKGYHSGSW